jgi:predicted secreted protein
VSLGSLVAALARSLPATLASLATLSALAVAAGVMFGLTVAGAISLYFVVWWTILFAVLPFGVRSQSEAGDIVPGSEPGAPAAPALRQRAIWTTLVSGAVFTGIAGLLPLAGL